MGSLPNSNYLSVTPNEKGSVSANNHTNRFHRHRRSAAISGDFDTMGLGLFSPNPQFNNNLHSQSKSISSIKNDELDKHFNFNNDEDFSRNSQDFLFPNAKRDKNLDSLLISTPPRYFNSPKKNLNSPIRLNQKKSFNHSQSQNQSHPHSQSQGLNTPKTKFFLTEETNINHDNVPDAVIDLDEILNANLHIGSFNSNGKKTEDIFPDDDLLSSPFLRPVSSPFSPSTSLPNNNTLFQQPIQENANDDIEEQDELDGRSDFPLHNLNDSTSRSASPRISDPEVDMELEPTDSQLDYQSSMQNDQDLFSNPPNIASDFYSHSSANSSSSSLKNRLIEKTFSNSSKDSNNSTVIQSHPNSTPKRSGAKANRYQSFYDQSFKVSNALKISSSESLTLSKPSSPQQSHLSLNQQSQPHSQLSLQSNSNGTNYTANNNLRMFKDSSNANGSSNGFNKSLAHSSSLPSLKSQRSLAKYQRYGDLRLKYSEMSKLSPPPAIASTSTTTSNAHSNNNTGYYSSIISGPPPGTNHSHQSSCHNSPTPNGGSGSTNSTTVVGVPSNSSPARKDLPKFIQKENKIELSSPSSLKHVSNSPVSIISDAGSTIISTNGTILSTAHSSLSSQLESNNTDTSHETQTQPSNLSACSNPNASSSEFKNLMVAPSIVVSSGKVSPSNSTTTFRSNELDTVHNTPVLSQESIASSSNDSSALNSPSLNSNTNGSSSPVRKSPRRPLTPGEQKLFKETAIPPYKDKNKKTLGSNSSSSNISMHNIISNKGKSRDNSKENLVLPPPKHSNGNGKTSHLSESPINKRRHHVKSKSFSVALHDLSPKLSKTSTFDDNSSIKLTKSNRLMSWFRKK